jgi:phosphate transport system substrate-binding protein
MTRLMPRSGFCFLCALAALLMAGAMTRGATSEPGAVADGATNVTAPDALASLPPYLPKAPVEGELKLGGSSAMAELAQLWAGGLSHLHPAAKLPIQTFSSGEVLSRLAAGEMEVGLMSRPLTAKELKQSGVVAIATARDVLGIVIHGDAPIDALTLEQGVRLLRDPNAADQPGARTWGDLGIQGAWATQPITLFGRNASTGAWGYLTNRFLSEGVASRTPTECAGYAEICDKVAKTPGSVGYVSLSLASPTGKVLALTLTTGETIAAPRPGEPVDPKYPLVRELYVVIKRNADGSLSPLAEEFLRYVLSRPGQEDTVKAGFLPLRRDEVLASRDQLGWTGKR